MNFPCLKAPNPLFHRSNAGRCNVPLNWTTGCPSEILQLHWTLLEISRSAEVLYKEIVENHSEALVETLNGRLMYLALTVLKIAESHQRFLDG